MCDCSSSCDCNSLISTSKGEKGDPGRSIAGVTNGSTGTAVVLTAEDSGQLFLLNVGAGKSYTLPTAPASGTFYEFQVLTDVTSNSYDILAGTSDTFAGHYFAMKSGDYAAFVKPAAGNNKFSMNGTTTGGLQGTLLRVVYESVLRKWVISGNTYGSGVLATSFNTV